MAIQSKTEINIRRLLSRCEIMATEAQQKDQPIDWRLKKYLQHLEKQLESLEQDGNSRVEEDTLREYRRKINFLHEIVKGDELVNPLERTLLCQHLLPSSVISSSSHSIENDLVTKELHLQAKTKHQKDLRKELFGTNDEDAFSLRHRKLGYRKCRTGGDNSTSTKENIDDILKQHHDMQEKVAEEMIKMAQSMKQTSLIARDIIKADNTALQQSTKVVETNSGKLKTETDRLDEINKKRCSWGIWIMLAIVCIVFINMIIFIKFFPKKKR